MTFHFRDGTSEHYGGHGGSEKLPFTLDDGEYISELTAWNGDAWGKQCAHGFLLKTTAGIYIHHVWMHVFFFLFLILIWWSTVIMFVINNRNIPNCLTSIRKLTKYFLWVNIDTLKKNICRCYINISDNFLSVKLQRFLQF